VALLKPVDASQIAQSRLAVHDKHTGVGEKDTQGIQRDVYLGRARTHSCRRASKFRRILDSKQDFT
jgi:hypothetical protein